MESRDMKFRTPFVPLAVLCTFLALMPARPAAAADLSPAQRKEVEQVIHDYLLHNPDVLIEALQAAENKLKSEAAAKSAKTLTARRREVFDDPATPVGGNPHGSATVVEFFDYQCPYCKRVQPELDSLLREDPKLRIVYKEFPVLGPVSLVAARAALAAMRQDKYAAFHDAMMAATGHITDDTVYKVATSVGLDLARLKRDMAGPQVSSQIQANLALADALDIHGTPTFVVGDQIVPGAIGLDSLKKLVADARKN
jgi:protein-disulfide isomerase